MKVRIVVLNALVATAVIVVGGAGVVVGQQEQAGAMRSASLRRADVFEPLKTNRFQPFPAARLTPEMRAMVGTGGNNQVSLCLYQLNGVCRGYWGLTLGNPDPKIGEPGHGLVTKYQTIPVRDHELLVQRTAWLNRCPTIWSNHINTVAPRAELADAASLARLTQGSDAPGWSAWDRTVLRAAEDLHQYRMITDETWKALREKYTEGQMFEVLMLVGHYTTVNMWFNTVGIQPGAPVHAMPADPGDKDRVNQRVKRVDPYPRLHSSGKGPRFQPLRRDQMTPPQREILNWATRTVHSDAEEGLLQVRFCLYHPELCRSYWYMTDRLRVKYSMMSIREHGLVVLRTAWLNRGETVWSNYLNEAAPRAGLANKESLDGIVAGPDSPNWNDWEKTLLRATDELHMKRFITDATWNALLKYFDEGRLVELIMLAGHTTNASGYFESVGIPPDGAPGLGGGAEPVRMVLPRHAAPNPTPPVLHMPPDPAR